MLPFVTIHINFQLVITVGNEILLETGFYSRGSATKEPKTVAQRNYTHLQTMMSAPAKRCIGFVPAPIASAWT